MAVKEAFDLATLDVDKSSENELRELVKHLQEQMQTTYQFWVGDWGNGPQAKSTRNGHYVKNAAVITYLSDN